MGCTCPASCHLHFKREPLPRSIPTSEPRSTLKPASGISSSATARRREWDEIFSSNSDRVYPPEPEKKEEIKKSEPCGRKTFAKSEKVDSGQICYVSKDTLDSLREYGHFAVLDTRDAITPTGTPLHMMTASVGAKVVTDLLGGSISLALSDTAVVGAGVLGGAVAGTVSMLWPDVVASDSAFYQKEDFAELQVANIGVRINVKYLPEESVNAYGIYTGKSEWRFVPVVAASPRGEQMVADLGNGIQVVWTPIEDTSRHLGIPALEGVPIDPLIWVFPEEKSAEQYFHRPLAPPDFHDAIVWFPGHPQIAPVYIALNLRGAPGVVTGVGEDVPGRWLAGANTGLGAPIPTRIADKLRGREFASFDTFRKAFWRAVGEDGELSGQFNPDNIRRMSKGQSPSAMYVDQVGMRVLFELHHVEHISKGGAVYDVDNLRVNTPKNHMEIHSGRKL